MKKLMIVGCGLLLAVGCKYTPSGFDDDFAEAACEWTVECYPDLYDSVEDCLDDEGDPVDTEDCEFDSDAAKTCVDETREMTCPDEGEFPEFPSACADVYTNCETGDTSSM